MVPLNAAVSVAIEQIARYGFRSSSLKALSSDGTHSLRNAARKQTIKI
jgi:hypothetical protein